MLAKEQELRELKAIHRKTVIALYAQLQKDFKDLQAKLKIKEDESELYEKQCIRLTEAFLQQGLNLPVDVPVDPPTPAPADPHDPNLIPGWDFTSEERARQEIASHGWGNVQQSNVVNNNGWGDTPAHALPPSPQPTLDGSHTGVSDAEQTYGWRNHPI